MTRWPFEQEGPIVFKGPRRHLSDCRFLSGGPLSPVHIAFRRRVMLSERSTFNLQVALKPRYRVMCVSSPPSSPPRIPPSLPLSHLALSGVI